MNLSEYTFLLNQPDAVQDKQAEVLEKIVQEFPYFQSARALYLKGLYNQNSFKYNYALKIAAAHTTDRSVLFDFITSDTFTTIQKEKIQVQTAPVLDIEEPENEAEAESLKLSTRENTVEQSIVASIKEASTVVAEEIDATETIEIPAMGISDEDFFPKDFISEKVAVSETAEIIAKTEKTAAPLAAIPEIKIEEKLEIGKPLDFSTQEKHSFQEWLQLSKFKPIVRDDTDVIPDVSSNESAKQSEDNQSISEPASTPSEVNFEKQKKKELIDKFIETNPRIPQIKHDVPLPGAFYESSKADNSMLMTETLARVYLEQKKYHKAIQAYEILILKYPEKSSFFADRILDIKNLQQNNT